MKYSRPSVNMEDWFQDPFDTKIWDAQVCYKKMAQYLHITYICIQVTAGYAYISLHWHGFSVVLTAWQVQALLFSTFWNFFFSQIFSIHSCWICRCKTHEYGRLTVNKNLHAKWQLILIFFFHFQGITEPMIKKITVLKSSSNTSKKSN